MCKVSGSVTWEKIVFGARSKNWKGCELGWVASPVAGAQFLFRGGRQCKLIFIRWLVGESENLSEKPTGLMQVVLCVACLTVS